MTSRRRTAKPGLSLAPLAVTFDGKLVLGLGWQSESDDLDAVVEKARRSGRAIFIGVVLADGEGREVLADLAEGVADTAGRLGPKVLARALSFAPRCCRSRPRLST